MGWLVGMLLFSGSRPAGCNEGIPPGVGRGRGGIRRPDERGGAGIFGFDKDGGDVGIDLLLEC